MAIKSECRNHYRLYYESWTERSEKSGLYFNYNVICEWRGPFIQIFKQRFLQNIDKYSFFQIELLTNGINCLTM